jgi:hypothetical protein
VESGVYAVTDRQVAIVGSTNDLNENCRKCCTRY